MNRPRNNTPVRLPDPIHRPDLQSRVHRGVFAVLSTLGWLVWLYLFAPLLSLVAWGLGYHRLDLYVLSSTPHVLLTLGLYASAVIVAGLLLLLWAVYNLLRFGSKDRRAAAPPVSDIELVQAFRINRDQLAQLHAGKVMHLHHDTDGHITGVETLMPRDVVGEPPCAVVANA